MPEIPGPRIDDARRRVGESVPKCVVTEEVARHAHVFRRRERHELTEKVISARECLGGGLPPDVASRESL
jgi:hypothetical protein